MSISKSRNKQQILADMFRELRKWNMSIPESVDRLDPVMKILLELYAHQLESIDKRIDQTWDVAVKSLIKAMAPEIKRWPVPAYTIMQCQTIDPVSELDTNTRFYYKEKREGGQTLFFSPARNEKVLSARVCAVFAKADDVIVDLTPRYTKEGAKVKPAPRSFSGKKPGQVIIGVNFEGMPSNLKDCTLFLNGPDSALRQLRWGYWYPGSNFGEFYNDVSFCPGIENPVDDIFTTSDSAVDWGGLRSSNDLFRDLENNFVKLPEKFTSTWEIGPLHDKITKALKKNNITLESDNEKLYWIKVELPEGGNREELLEGIDLYFNCVVALNKHELSTYKYTGGNKLVEIEIPDHLDTIVEITSVIDSGGVEYLPVYKLLSRTSEQIYSVEEKDDKLIIWIDYSTHLDKLPDFITVTYTVTGGVDANGIAAGQINELYEKHPGLSGVVNVIPTRGAIPAKTEQQIIDEISLRLRNRDRVLNFDDIASWTRTFDPRIKNVTCENSIERAPRGIRRCILVKVYVSGEDFYSDDETRLLTNRLIEYLKSRSPVNSAFQVEIIKK